MTISARMISTLIIGFRGEDKVHDNSSKTISPIRQLVAYDFWSMRHFAVRHLVEKNSQVRHSVEIVKSLFLTKRRTRRNVACH